MFSYIKRLQYPVNIKKKDLRMAKYLVTQYGGSNGELAAALRSLNQRYTMPDNRGKALLTDIGTEELAHLEIIGAIVRQLTRNLSVDQLKAEGFEPYFVDHTIGIYPASASGVPFTASYLQSKGDPITDLTENMAAEQKARTTYENILKLVDDPDVLDPIRFLREREIVHFQRFGESMLPDSNRTQKVCFFRYINPRSYR